MVSGKLGFITVFRVGRASVAISLRVIEDGMGIFMDDHITRIVAFGKLLAERDHNVGIVRKDLHILSPFSFLGGRGLFAVLFFDDLVNYPAFFFRDL